MESLAYLFPLIALAGVGAIALVIVAVAQDMRQERKYGYRQAFFTIVTLAMLVMAVGSGISLLSIGLKHFAFKGAIEYSQRYNSPPAPFLSVTPEKSLTTTAYTCEADCQLTDADKQAFQDWKSSYQSWKTSHQADLQLRRDLAGSLSMFLIALPLFLVFLGLMSRGAKEELSLHSRPSPLRSVYYYGVAFAGLVLAVIGAAMILNSVLRVALKTDEASRYTTPIPVTSSERVWADSLLNCASKCGFSDEDTALVREWKTEYESYRKKQESNEGAIQNDLATTIPLLAFGLPLFWYHFTRIRKESQTPSAPKVA